uniref:Pheromone shutdown protein n=2 Tax=Kalanchoe fedtschenkoi TaxID=63787 RepID=A0A7N0RIP6_KALFE
MCNQVVFIELCSGRVAILTHQNLKVPTLKEMVDSLKKKQNPFGIIYGWFLAKVANQLEVFPGAEFRVAFDEAMKYGGKVVLGDRPIQITLRRTWAKMPVWHKTKLLTSLFFQSLFLPSASVLNKMLKEMNDSDMLTLVVQEMSKRFPTLMETLVHERDQYMSSTLLRVSKESRSVVAVVGKGHLKGIKEHWQQPIDLAKLMEMPSHKPRITVKRIVGTLGAGVAVAAIVGGLFFSRKK